VAHKLSWFSTDHVGVLLAKIKKIPKNTNGRLAIPAPAGLLVFYVGVQVRSAQVQQIEDDAWRIAHDRKSWRALRPVAGQAFH